MAASYAFPTTAAKPIERPRTGIGEDSEALGKVAMSGPTPPEGVKDAIEDDEEGEDTLDRPDGAAVDEPEKAPAEEAEGHYLFVTSAVHGEVTGCAAGEVEVPQRCLGRRLSEFGMRLSYCERGTSEWRESIPQPMFSIKALFGLIREMVVEENKSSRYYIELYQDQTRANKHFCWLSRTA